MCLASLGGAARPSGALWSRPANRAAHRIDPSPQRLQPQSAWHPRTATHSVAGTRASLLLYCMLHVLRPKSSHDPGAPRTQYWDSLLFCMQSLAAGAE